MLRVYGIQHGSRPMSATSLDYPEHHYALTRLERMDTPRGRGSDSFGYVAGVG